MPSLEDLYWKWQPMLLEVCELLKREVSESLADNPDCTCDFRVVDVGEFVASSNPREKTTDARTDSTGLIVGVVTAPTEDQLRSARQIASKLFTIHEENELAVICVIPPWAKPAAWDESLALPTHLTICFIVEKPESLENEDAEAISLFQPLTLALSGGGVRAALYQLGILVFLAQQKQLKNVQEIVSVSGGSILAAHFVKHWVSATGELNEFRKVAAELLKICRSDIRNRIFIRWIWSRLLPWCWFLRNWGLTGRLRAEYQRIFGTTTLGDLDDSCPGVAFVATDIVKHQRVAFTSSQILRWSFQGDEHSRPAPILSKGVELSLAVAASSCFPPVFPRLLLKHEDLDITYGEFKEELDLNDGGVVTNLGIEVLIALRKLEWTRGKVILIADAERKLAVKPGNTPMASIDATLAALGKTSREAAKREFGAKAVLIPFTDRVQSKDGLSIPAETALFNYRTDLDCPTWQEIHGLMIHGAMVARHATNKRFEPVAADVLKNTISTIIAEAGGPVDLPMPTKADFRRCGKRSYVQIIAHSLIAVLLLFGLASGLRYTIPSVMKTLKAGQFGKESAGRLLEQSKEMTEVSDTGEYEVFYPQPYVSAPGLTWNPAPSSFKITEQRPDGFIIKIQSYTYGSKPPRWIASGVPKDKSGGNRDAKTRHRVIKSAELSWYDEPIALLDNTLFVSQDFQSVKFGGRNINLVTIDIRTKKGHAVEWRVQKDAKHSYSIVLDVKAEPYIEFEYRGVLYALEFIGPVKAKFTLSKIDEPTLQLKAVKISE